MFLLMQSKLNQIGLIRMILDPRINHIYLKSHPTWTWSKLFPKLKLKSSYIWVTKKIWVRLGLGELYNLVKSKFKSD